MKLCKDCKYSSDSTEYAICQRTIKPKQSLVNGWICIEDYWNCHWSRRCTWLEVTLFKTCGKSGKYWEAK